MTMDSQPASRQLLASSQQLTVCRQPTAASVRSKPPAVSMLHLGEEQQTFCGDGDGRDEECGVCVCVCVFVCVEDEPIANLGLVVQLVASPACFRARGFESASRDQFFLARLATATRHRDRAPASCSCLVPRHAGDAFAPQ